MNGIFLPRGLIAALQFLTRIPTPALADYSPDDQVAAAPWYPPAGGLVGFVVAGAAWTGGLASPWVSALLAVVAWVWVTGALHLDGLADVADGLGAAHRDPARFIAAAKDPHTGSFGVIAIVLMLMAKIVLLANLTTIAPPYVWLPGLALIPAWARWGPLVWRTMVPPLGAGWGEAFSSGRDWRWVAVHGVLLASASLWLAPVLLAAFAVVPLLGLYWRWRLQGMTGDCHGASIEVTEILLLLALVLSG